MAIGEFKDITSDLWRIYVDGYCEKKHFKIHFALVRGAVSNLEVGWGAQLRREAQQLLKVGGTCPATSDSGRARALPCPTVPAPLALVIKVNSSIYVSKEIRTQRGYGRSCLLWESPSNYPTPAEKSLQIWTNCRAHQFCSGGAQAPFSPP
jgi:hypothetical protein